MTWPDELRDWTARLAAAQVPSPEADARWLAAHVLGCSATAVGLIAAPDRAALARIDALVARRERREPLQHLLGTAPFLDLELAVGPGVFVPRPETELLADHVIRWLRARSSVDRPDTTPAEVEPEVAAAALTAGQARAEEETPSVEPVETTAACTATSRWSRQARPTRFVESETGATGPVVVDLCTGSGALALAIACHVAGARVTAVELSDAALTYAVRNVGAAAPRLAGAGSRVELVQADLTAPGVEDTSWVEDLAGAVDAVVVNPPYVPDGAVPREPEVRDYDPSTALFGGVDGFDVIRPVLVVAARLLRAGGLLAIEHGDEQGGPGGVPGLVVASGSFDDVVDHLDLAGKPRFTAARRR